MRRPPESPDPAAATAGAASSWHIMDSLLEGCQVIDFDHRYLYVNPAVAMHGRTTCEALIGRTMSEAYPGIEHTEVYALITSCLRHRTHHEMESEFQFPDGSLGWFEVRIQPVREGAFILSIEITARKRAERRVEHLNALLRGLRDVNQLVARERDAATLARDAAQILVDALGFSTVAVLRRERSGEWRTEVAAAPGQGQALRARLAGGSEGAPSASATPARTLPGSLPPCVVRVMEAPLEAGARQPAFEICTGEGADDPDGFAVRMECEREAYGALYIEGPRGLGEDGDERALLSEVASDVAWALRALEREAHLLQAQRMESVGRLAGGVAHDFNNLLTVINSYAELCQAILPEDTPVAPHLQQIVRAAGRAAALTRQLLTFGRRHDAQPQMVALNAAVEHLQHMLTRVVGEHLRFVVELDPRVGAVLIDPVQLEQVIVNLVVNARDAMPAGGTLSVRTRLVGLKGGAESAPSLPAGRYAALEVVDTGVGMDAHTQARVFEPFFTTKPVGQGTGLGLATVWAITRGAGGGVELESAPGRGSTFRVYLPSHDVTEPDGASPAEAAARGRGEGVLVVEDEAPVRELVREVLEAAGYRVWCAPDPAAALTIWSANRAEIALVVCDVVMPGESGHRFGDRLRAASPSLRLLYISGYADPAVAGGRPEGAAFLPKPFSVEELRRRVRAALDA